MTDLDKLKVALEKERVALSYVLQGTTLCNYASEHEDRIRQLECEIVKLEMKRDQHDMFKMQ